jgi:hypothetical protein
MRANTIAKAFLLLIGLAFLNVAIQALFTPQAVMGNVGISLDNPSALNSIRAYYGGVNLFFGLFLAYSGFKAQATGLILSILYSGGFVAGRLLSFALDGQPNGFVTKWLFVESFVLIVSLLLYRAINRQQVAMA